MDIIPKDFIWDEYITIYNDLRNIKTKIDAERHYIKFGIKECRFYNFKMILDNLPSDFCWVEYKQCNIDLKLCNKYECMINYLKTGKIRKYRFNFSRDFNLEEYKKINNIMYDEEAKIKYFNSDQFIKNPHLLSSSRYYIANAYFISCINSGGSYKYMLDMSDAFPYINFKIVSSKAQLENIKFDISDIILIQQINLCDITYNDIINIKLSYGCKLVLTIHDHIWITNSSNNKCFFGNYLKKDINVNSKIKSFFRGLDEIIVPSLFMYNTYSNYFSTEIMDKFNICEHIDLNIFREDSYNKYGNMLILNNIYNNFNRQDKNYFNFNLGIFSNSSISFNVDIPTNIVEDEDINEINIGMMTDPSEVKGIELVKILYNKYGKYKNYIINIKIIGINMTSYEEDKFNEHILKYKINGLLYLSKYGESYSYALTKYLGSELPILYNNFGSFKQRIPKDDKYFIVLNDESEFTGELKSPKLLFERFEAFLDFIIDNKLEYRLLNNKINIPDFYTKLFTDKYRNMRLFIVISDKPDNIIKYIRKYIPNSYITYYDVDLFIKSKLVNEKEIISYLNLFEDVYKITDDLIPQKIN